jgi:hypothetical protein
VLALSRFPTSIALAWLIGLAGCTSTPRGPTIFQECGLPRGNWEPLPAGPSSSPDFIAKTKTASMDVERFWFANDEGDLLLCNLPADPEERDYSRSRPGCAASIWIIKHGTDLPEQPYVLVCSD